jgi:hypothetical protein
MRQARRSLTSTRFVAPLDILENVVLDARSPGSREHIEAVR